MFEDPDFWLVLISLAITAASLAHWLGRAGDDWLESQLDESDLVHDRGAGQHGIV